MLAETIPAMTTATQGPCYFEPGRGYLRAEEMAMCYLLCETYFRLKLKNISG